MPVSTSHVVTPKSDGVGCMLFLHPFAPPDSAPRHHLLSNYKILTFTMYYNFNNSIYSIPSPISSLTESSSVDDVRESRIVTSSVYVVIFHSIILLVPDIIIPYSLLGRFSWFQKFQKFQKRILISVDVLLAKLLSIDTCSMIQYRNTSSAEVQDTDCFPHVLLS